MAHSSRPAYLMSSNEHINVGSDNLAACPPKSSLLGLSKELRLEIYRYLLSTKYIRCKTPYQKGRFETNYYTYPFHKQILRTCRQVYHEAMYTYRVDNLFIRFTTNHPSVWHILWELRDLLFLTLSDHASPFRCCAMKVKHHCPITWPLEDHEKRICTKLKSITWLLVSDELPNMLRTLMAYSQQGDRALARSSFRVYVYNKIGQWDTETEPGPRSVHPRIRNLLDPFKLLYEVASLEIKGSVSQEYKQSVISSATQPEPTVAAIITTAFAIKTQGDEAYHKHQFDLALSLYTSAISDIQVNHYWAEYTGSLTTGEYAISIPRAVRLAKIRLHSNLAATLVKVGEYRRAIDHAKEAIKHIVTPVTSPEEWEGLSFSDCDRAKPLLWGGLAYEQLGDLNRAIYGVGEACWHDPKDKRLVDEYERLEGEMVRQCVIPTAHAFGKGTNWWID